LFIYFLIWKDEYAWQLEMGREGDDNVVSVGTVLTFAYKK
jgi:hypothetical protein